MFDIFIKRFIFLLVALLIFSGCSMQDGANKNYIISQSKEKEASEIEASH